MQSMKTRAAGRDHRQQACSMGMSPISPELVSFSLEAMISAGWSSNIYTGALAEESYLCLHTGLVYHMALS